jgi:hypothetical protein
MLLLIPGFGKILGITGKVLKGGGGGFGGEKAGDGGDGLGRRLGGEAGFGCGTAFETIYVEKLRNMDKTMRGGIVSGSGIISLVAAFVMMNTGDAARHLGLMFAGGVLGTVAFFAGIWMMPDKSRSVP